MGLMVAPGFIKSTSSSWLLGAGVEVVGLLVSFLSTSLGLTADFCDSR